MSWGTAFNVAATLFGASETSRTNSISEKMQAEQVAIQKEMLEMGKLRESYDTDMRQDQKDMIDRYQKTLKGVFERLGSRQSVNEQTIRGDMDTYYNQNLGDLNNVIDRVNSQGYANQRSRGMLDSSVEDDRKRELTNKYAGLMSTARTDAQDRAFKKASDYETLVSTNRSNIMGEYDNLYTQPFNMMNTARKSDGQGALTGAANVASSVAASAQANATNTANAFGRELENLRENDWNFDYKYKPEKDKK